MIFSFVGSGFILVGFSLFGGIFFISVRLIVIILVFFEFIFAASIIKNNYVGIVFELFAGGLVEEKVGFYLEFLFSIGMYSGFGIIF